MNANRTDNVNMPETEFRELLEAAAEAGAARALARVGLHDDSAASDLREVRELLGEYRELKKVAIRAATRLAVRLLMGAVLVAGLIVAPIPWPWGRH